MTFNPREHCLNCFHYGLWIIPMMVIVGIFVFVDWLTNGEPENIGYKSSDRVNYAGVKKWMVEP